MLPQVLPGTTSPTMGAQITRDVLENAGPVAAFAVPGAGQAVLAGSTFGNSVAQAHLEADENDRRADQIAPTDPELAARLHANAQLMRDNARLRGVLDTGTVLAAGKVLPQAQSVLGQTARSAGEMELITTTNDQVWNPMLGYQPGDPAAIPQSMLMGAAMGHAGALAGKWKAGGSFGDAGPVSSPGLFRYKVPLPRFHDGTSPVFGSGEFDPAVHLGDPFADGSAAAQAGTPPHWSERALTHELHGASDTVPMAPGFSDGHASADVYARPIEVSSPLLQPISDAHQAEPPSEDESEYAGVTAASDSQVSASANGDSPGGIPSKAPDQFYDPVPPPGPRAAPGSGSSSGGRTPPPRERPAPTPAERFAPGTVPPAPPTFDIKPAGDASGDPISKADGQFPAFSDEEAEPLPLKPYEDGDGRLKNGDLTTYKDFEKRSKRYDNLEPHELWQHANLNHYGLATYRGSTDPSKDNPVIVLDRATHIKVTAEQNKLNAVKAHPFDSIQANANLLRRMKIADPASFEMLDFATIDAAEQAALKHARNQGFRP